ncbi:very short patch repair endonuclease [Nocardia salmonicida]|uniref:very short patch repair endonuclease n=1 Tax=Nocardia salmonicida TaxID=53431 RepID=UPI003432E193
MAATTRRENLRLAWRLVIERALLPHPTEVAKSWASSPATRAVMRANRRRDTDPELALRSALRGHGLGYRVDARPLPELRRRADVVFVGARVAVFCDGCFWHGCPDHYRPARRNGEFWAAKIAGNRDRDRDTDERLTNAGWVAIRVWEHEDPAAAADRIADVVVTRRTVIRSSVAGA